MLQPAKTEVLKIAMTSLKGREIIACAACAVPDHERIAVAMTEITQLASCVLLRFGDGLEKLRDGVQQYDFAEVDLSSEFCGDEADARWGAEG